MTAAAITTAFMIIVAGLLIAVTGMALARPPRPFAPGPPARQRPWWLAGLIAAVCVGVVMTVVVTVLGKVTVSSLPARPHYQGVPAGHGDTALALFYVAVAVTATRTLVTTSLRGSVRQTAAGLLLASVPAWWYFHPAWATTDLAALLILLGVAPAFQFRLPFAGMALAGLALASGYDAVQVLVTGNMTVSGAAGAMEWLPVAFYWPAGIGWHALPLIEVGLGDIAAPAALVITAGRHGQRLGRRVFYWSAVAGYAAGLVVAAVVLVCWPGIVLPLTVFTVPGITCGVLAAAWRTGQLRDLTRPLEFPGDKPPAIARLGASAPQPGFKVAFGRRADNARREQDSQ